MEGREINSVMFLTPDEYKLRNIAFIYYPLHYYLSKIYHPEVFSVISKEKNLRDGSSFFGVVMYVIQSKTTNITLTQIPAFILRPPFQEMLNLV